MAFTVNDWCLRPVASSFSAQSEILDDDLFFSNEQLDVVRLLSHGLHREFGCTLLLSSCLSDTRLCQTHKVIKTYLLAVLLSARSPWVSQPGDSCSPREMQSKCGMCTSHASIHHVLQQIHTQKLPGIDDQHFDAQFCELDLFAHLEVRILTGCTYFLGSHMAVHTIIAIYTALSLLVPMQHQYHA